MSNECSKAISFANSYFTLVDGLATGLEEHLSEDVVLHWFDKTIKGKARVNHFLKARKVTSRHVFNNIVPTEEIEYKKYLKRKFWRQLDDLKQTSSNSSSENNDCSLQSTDMEGSHLMEEDVSHEVNNNEITPMMLEKMEKLNVGETVAKVDEIVEGIIQEKSCQNYELEIDIQEKNIKLVEATGEVHLWKRALGEDFYSALPKSTHICKRKCKLQIAYSLTEAESFFDFTNINTTRKLGPSIPSVQQKRLPSFEEMSELSNHLVPNINHFGGYLRQRNFSEDRENFLKSFGAEIAKNDSPFPRLVPHYEGNKLVFRKTDFTESEQSDNFVFKYKIHLIIYEGEKRCKLERTAEKSEESDQME